MDDIMAAMLELTQQHTARIETLQQQMELQVMAHTQ